MRSETTARSPQRLAVVDPRLNPLVDLIVRLVADELLAEIDQAGKEPKAAPTAPLNEKAAQACQGVRGNKDFHNGEHTAKPDAQEEEGQS